MHFEVFKIAPKRLRSGSKRELIDATNGGNFLDGQTREISGPT